MKNLIKCNILFIIFMLISIVSFGQTEEKGIIRGKIIDKASGETLMFTNVLIKGSNPPIGGQTDLDGNYEIKVAPGTYSLIVSYIGYADNVIDNIQVSKGDPQIVDFLMEAEGFVIEEVVVTEERINRTGNAVLALQAKSLTVQDGIASDDISRRGVSNAAQTMQSVTGASVVDGKYIYVRGLGDRYSNARLNGQPIPSTDPYRNSSQLDLIPANLLDNIIASKTFTPDQPGNFTGGSVNIQTKSFPERKTFAVNVSTSFNTQSSLRDDFLTQSTSGTDWLGFDGGRRGIPDFLNDPEVRSMLRSSIRLSARTNQGIADTLDRAAKAFNPEMSPIRGNSSLNHSFGFSFGNQYSIGENKLGLIIGANYRRNYSYYANGVNQYFELTDPNSGLLNPYYTFSDTKGTDNPVLGGLASLAYKFGGSNKIIFNALYNHDTENTAQYLAGPHPGIISGEGIFESRVVSFTERAIQSYQLNGEHAIGSKGIKVEWGGGYTNAQQSEPDLRQFANILRLRDNGDTTFIINQAEFALPFHYFRELNDQQYSGKLDFTIPFAQTKSRANKIQFGALYTQKDRDFTEYIFQINNDASGVVPYSGNALEYFGPENSGVVGVNPDNNRNIIGLFPIFEANNSLENSYDGTERVTAGYAMAVYDFGKIKTILGARAEQTDFSVASRDTTEEQGNIDALDILPSINFIYQLKEEGTNRMNIRASFSQTLARPNMRELAPFSAINFTGGFRVTGNPLLERTQIKNYDLRWEWFPKPGELYAVSAYYKDFKNPIVQAFLPVAANPEIQFQNVDQALVYGLEFELRKSLGFIAPKLKDLKFTTNLSIIHSEVDISESEQMVIEQFNPEKGNTRQFQGQSPFIFNAGLNYNNSDRKIDAIVTYNLFGERLAEISEGRNPDIFEQPRHMLNFSIKKSFENGFGVRIRANNLLDAAYKKTMTYQGEEYTIQDFQRGRTFGVSLSYLIK